MAKDLVRTRNTCKKFMIMKANIQAVSLKITTLKSNYAMAQAMKGVTKAMQTMNKKMNLPEIQKIMMEFEKQSEIMDMKEEMMDDAIDSALGDDDDEVEGYISYIFLIIIRHFSYKYINIKEIKLYHKYWKKLALN